MRLKPERLLIATIPAFLAGLLVTPAQATESNEGKKTKVLILPYQPIFLSVPQKTVQKATKLLNKELGQKETLEVVRGAVSDNATGGPSLEEAQKLLKEAAKLEAEREISAAITARQKALKLMKDNASAIKDANDFLVATHELARALMWAARDKEAASLIDQAARMAPNFKPEPQNFSRYYRKKFNKAAQKAVRSKPGKLMVKSALPGAKIFLDGREMEIAPVLLRGAVPGRHLLTARLEGVPQAAAFVDIKAGKQTEVTMRFGNTRGGAEVGQVAEAIADNKISSKAFTSAVKAGKSAGADFVVAGALSKAEDHYRVHTYVINVAKGAMQKMDEVKFDLDMLTAESDVLRVVRGVEESLGKFSGSMKQLATIEKRMRRPRSVVNRALARPEFVATNSGKNNGRRGPLKAGGRKAVLKPLKGSRIQIKDEED